MSDRRPVERLFMASVHKALEDLAPEKLEVFEGWFKPADRARRLHLAPVLAAISYLRRDPSVYGRVMERAGRYASQWSYLERPRIERHFFGAIPMPARGLLAGYVLRSGLRGVHRDGRLRVVLQRERLLIDVRNSLFCRLGGSGEEPLCGYYGALFAGLLDRTGLARPPVVEAECHGRGNATCRFEATR